MAYIENDQNGIMKIRQGENDYTVWTHSEIVILYIKKFLKEKFPGKLIIRELFGTDLSVPEENLPVEIQATPCTNGGIHYSSWENSARVQIDQNIASYDRCWFFFDSELLNAMRNASRCMTINMDWFRKYVEEEKLKVFTVSCNGIINELEYKDLNFLSHMSQLCRVASETGSVDDNEETGTGSDESIEDMLDDDHDIEKNIVDCSTTEGWFVFNRGLSFFWKPSSIRILDKSLDSYVAMERYDLIEFLQKSDFLPQHGYEIVKNADKKEE